MRSLLAAPALTLGLMLAFALGCGEEVRLRSLVLDVQGLSGRAERLVVLLFPASTAQSCAGISLENVKSLSAPFSAEWIRSSDGNERSIELPAVEESAITVVAYSEDAQGMPIQFGCTEIDYLELESPEASLRLSMRVASRAAILPACRSSGPSSSSGCSVAVEWPRLFSATRGAIRSTARSS